MNPKEMDRLFVALNTEPWELFVDGSKDVELRGFDTKFNLSTVVPGREVELRRGYSTDDSLWGEIGEQWHGTLPNILQFVGHERILPGYSRAEFLRSVEEMLPGHDRYIAFSVEDIRLAGEEPRYRCWKHDEWFDSRHHTREHIETDGHVDSDEPKRYRVRWVTCVECDQRYPVGGDVNVIGSNPERAEHHDEACSVYRALRQRDLYSET